MSENNNFLAKFHNLHAEPVFEIDPAGRMAAAAEIVRAHSEDQIERILTWADRDIAERMRMLMARNGIRSAA